MLGGFFNREVEPKGRHENNILTSQTKRSSLANPDMGYLGVRRILARITVTVLNVCLPLNLQYQLHSTKIKSQSWIISSDLNSHSTQKGYKQVKNEGGAVQNWTKGFWLLLINKRDDPDIIYFRLRKTTSTVDPAVSIFLMASKESHTQQYRHILHRGHRTVILVIKCWLLATRESHQQAKISPSKI